MIALAMTDDQPASLRGAESEGGEALSSIKLDHLDITSDRLSLKGLDADLDDFADGPLLAAILDGCKHAPPHTRQQHAQSTLQINIIFSLSSV